MVRLVLTNFPFAHEIKEFYAEGFEKNMKRMFFYNGFNNKEEVYLPKEDLKKTKFYSINELSQNFIEDNNFLVYISDRQFNILFDHITISSTILDKKYKIEDIIKLIIITKHLSILSSGGDLEKIFYVIDSEHKSTIEHLLKINTMNENAQIIAKDLGTKEELIPKLTELDTSESFIFKQLQLLLVTTITFCAIFFGAELLFKKIQPYEDITSIESKISNSNTEININERREKSLIKKLTDLKSCMKKVDK